MTSGKKVGGSQTKTKFLKMIEIWTNSHRGYVKRYYVVIKNPQNFPFKCLSSTTLSNNKSKFY